MSNTNSSPLKVGIKKGTFYLSEDVAKDESWEKQEFKNPQTGVDMIKYHKNLSLVGELVYVGHVEDKFKGNCLSVLIKGDEGTYALLIPILDSKGVKSTNSYFNSLVGSLEDLKKGEKITMFVNNKNEDKKGDLYKNIVTLREGNKLVKSLFSFSDVPKWLVSTKKNAFGKEETVYDPTPTNDFYIAKFLKIVEDFKSSTPKKENVPTPQAQKTKIPEQAFEPVDEDDDMPF